MGARTTPTSACSAPPPPATDRARPGRWRPARTPPTTGACSPAPRWTSTPDAEPGEERRAEPRGLQLDRAVDEQPHGSACSWHSRSLAAAPPSIASRASGHLAVAGHEVDHVAHLEGDRLERGAGDVRAGGAAGDADDQPAGRRVPVGGAEAGQRGHEHHAAGVGDAGGEGLDVGGRLDDAQPVAQPLDRRAGDEDRALEREVATPVRVGERHGGEQAAARAPDLVAGVDEQERAGAVGALRGAGGEAGLAEQGGLLVAGDAGDRQVEAEERRGVGVRELPVGRDDLGQRATRARRTARTAARLHVPEAGPNSSVREALEASVTWCSPRVIRAIR